MKRNLVWKPHACSQTNSSTGCRLCMRPTSSTETSNPTTSSWVRAMKIGCATSLTLDWQSVILIGRPEITSPTERVKQSLAQPGTQVSRHTSASSSRGEMTSKRLATCWSTSWRARCHGKVSAALIKTISTSWSKRKRSKPRWTSCARVYQKSSQFIWILCAGWNLKKCQTTSTCDKSSQSY